MTNDPVIDEIRRVRRKISAEIGPELEGLVERYAKMERRFDKPPSRRATSKAVRSAATAE